MGILSSQLLKTLIHKRIGTTIDDALGEAFDKTARLLKMGYPGGPEIEKYAALGDENRFQLPMPIIMKMHIFPLQV